MSPGWSVRLANLRTVGRLARRALSDPGAAIMAVAVSGRADGTVDLCSEGIGDERHCVAAACQLLIDAHTIITRDGTTDTDVRPQIDAALDILCEPVAG